MMADPDCFSEPLTPEALYWIGFLFADGCVEKNSRSPRIQVGLAIRDLGHLHKFADFLKLPRTRVTEYLHLPHPTAVIGFRRKQISSFLLKLGLTPNKSLTVKAPGDFAMNRDFWRGIFDGDGALAVYPHHLGPQIALCGSIYMIQQFLVVIKSLFNLSPALSKNRTIYQTTIAGRQVKPIISWMYYPGCIALNRKLEIADKILKW